MDGTLTADGQMNPKQVFGGPVNVALRGGFGSGTLTIGACDVPSTTNTDYVTLGIATAGTLTQFTAVPRGWFVSGFLANSTSPTLAYQIG